MFLINDKLIDQIHDTLFDTAVSGAIGYGLGYAVRYIPSLPLLTLTVDPISTATFMVVGSLVSKLTAGIFNERIGVWVGHITGCLAAYTVTAAVGLTVTPAGLAVLALGAIVTNLVFSCMEWIGMIPENKAAEVKIG